VVFAKFELMMPYFVVTSQRYQEAYNVHAFPTVILFVDGKVRYRWVCEYNLDDYRAKLNQALRER
jgi:hypothetical protein